ncbi:NED1 [Enterospora canceri]|uniref:NED1 n=1 Tax=Enterospora canceri TaxID=1081671 RepID=A0A1Y1S9F0_9MICR|nr:NED1 [Enterospora canceri]
MGVVNKIFTSVSEIYNSVNPITLSGVNDVIVIKKQDGSYKCSPFQLRFSKMQFLNSRSQVVHLLINGRMTDVNMTITPQGDLYFEESVDFDVSYLSKEQYDESLVLSIMENAFFDTDPCKEEQSKSQTQSHCDTKAEENKIYLNPGFSQSAQFMGSKEEAVSSKGNLLVVDKTNKRFALHNYLSAADILDWKRQRMLNLRRRIYSKNIHFKANYENYYDLSMLYEKFSYLLPSTEHCEFLINKHHELLLLLEAVYENRPGTTFQFSKSHYVRIENGKPHATFSKYVTRKIEDAESLIVLLQDDRTSFFLTYVQFCTVFFEVKMSRNRRKHLLDILEQMHNESLGWNLFGSRKPVKRDIQFTLFLNSEELKGLHLKKGKNEAVFKIGGIDEQLESYIYLWEETDKLVVSDIDGTITKSDVWGLISGYIGTDWTHVGVAPLFSKIVENGYKIIYLSSRSLGQSHTTREYLEKVEQDSHRLPDGPILLNPDGLMGALYREVIAKKAGEFKVAVLRAIKELFDPKCREGVFVAGFGNKLSDVVSYTTLNIPKTRIYTINPKGQIHSEYSASLIGSYVTLNEFIDTIFPAIDESEEFSTTNLFNEFNYWL